MTIQASTISTVWLALLRDQHQMVYAEIQQLVPELPRSMVDNALSAGFRYGYFERTGKRFSYAYRVTPRCNVPPGIRVLDVLEAVE